MDFGLTKREKEVVGLIVEGLSYHRLARRLGVSQSVVKFHLTNIYRKMDCDGQVQVVVKAMQVGLIPLPVVRQATAQGNAA